MDRQIQRQLVTRAYAAHDELQSESLAALRFRDQEFVAIAEGIGDFDTGQIKIPSHLVHSALYLRDFIYFAANNICGLLILCRAVDFVTLEHPIAGTT